MIVTTAADVTTIATTVVITEIAGITVTIVTSGTTVITVIIATGGPIRLGATRSIPCRVDSQLAKCAAC